MEQRNSCSSAGTSIYGIALVLALAVFGLGIYLAASQHGWAILAAGCVCVVAVMIAWPLAAAITSAQRRQLDFETALQERLQQLSVLLNVVTEQQLLSDRAKAVAFREKDREALRRAINEDVARKDYEGAIVLVDEMEAAFGYKHEADKYRQEISERRDGQLRKEAAEYIARIDDYCRAEKWTEAIREAETAMGLFPTLDIVQRLPQDIEDRRVDQKQELLDGWHDALNRKDIDGSIEILKRLDLYLTRAEADNMQESVRAIFKEKLHNLRVQFTLAVQDRKWTEAIRTGELIVRDFPNSGIAREVRNKLEALRQRALEPDEEAATV